MTRLLYLESTNAFDETASVLDVGMDARGTYIVVNQTIFYPQGGGQAADRGNIVAGDKRIAVTHVAYENGRVKHYVSAEAIEEVKLAARVILQVDPDYRIVNARLHSGGHLVSHVVELFYPALVPIKGFHFSEGAYVEFVREAGVSFDGLSVEQIQSGLNQVAGTSLPIVASYSTYDTIRKLRPRLAEHIPQEKPSRLVKIGDFLPLPCGGTHLRSLTELESVSIKKIKTRGQNVRISYELGTATQIASEL